MPQQLTDHVERPVSIPHLFEERGVLERGATLASQWLVEFLVVQPTR